jgi:hypothetical protein
MSRRYRQGVPMTGQPPRMATLLRPVEITYTTMLYGRRHVVTLYTYAEVVAWLLLMTGPGKPSLLIINVRQP